jgi:LysM repeat protein
MQRIPASAPILALFAIAVSLHADTAASPEVYVVQKGDSLYAIAQARLGDASLWPRLAAYNGLEDPNTIRVGQKVLVPDEAQLHLAAQEARQRAVDSNAIAALRAELRALRRGLARDGVGLAPLYDTRFERRSDVGPGWMFPAQGRWRVAKSGTHVLEQYDRGDGNKEAVVGEPDWANYIVEAEIHIRHSGDAGVFAHYQQYEANYRLRTANRFQRLQLTKRQPRPDGSYDTLLLADIPFAMEEDRWHKFRLRVEASDGGIYLQGKVWQKGRPEPEEWTIEAADDSPNTYRSGRAGVWTWKAGESYRGTEFDNFAVLALP